MKFVVFSALFCSLLVGIPTLLFSHGNWLELIVRTAIAIFIGCMIGIEISREDLKYPNVAQSIFGFLAGGIFAYWLESTVTFMVLGSVIGLLLGLTARWWVKYAQLP
ncbi:hypothetical protein [Enterovibrio norvegicus]|uniref:hypothetical protein n=1 Tax=Enterovibrio norvegicus TaxID=188144 RepID=UPI000C83B6A4|nr:hypothetical protein [Enterovibrio norvegicus]PML76091.1 hypothetical protein BCT69_05440 [Enterovibrio norvegicus]